MSIKAKKIASSFVKEISYIIMEEIKDPEIKFVTITDCEVTNDLSFATVYFTVLDKERKEETIEALNRAANFIEIELSKRINIRKMPDITFEYDTSIEYGERIEQKIKDLNI
ncbi:MAG TPA: 30S ribosome-binding factor RbfA [Bacilli bacterium]|nr:30S ribosome-binding factor RbfA [Bacilli bacterium]